MGTAATNEIFTALYRTWAPRIFNHFRRLSWAPEDASDLTSEVFTIAWSRLPDVREKERTGAWLWSIARNQASNRARGEDRRRQREEDAAAEHTSSDTPEGSRQRLHRAFTALPETDRELLLWREHSGLCYREIAELTGQTEDGVRSSLYRARRRLKQEFDKRWE